MEKTSPTQASSENTNQNQEVKPANHAVETPPIQFTSEPPKQNTNPQPAVTTNSNAPNYATFSKRAWAVTIDGLIVGTISLLLNLPAYITDFKNLYSSLTDQIAAGSTNPSIEAAMKSTHNPLYTILSIISFAMGVAYPVYFIGKSGQTPGKKLMKIKVIDKETQKAPGYIKAFLREVIGKTIDAISFYLGYLWVLWDKEKQGWHDKIAGTIVVVNE